MRLVRAEVLDLWRAGKTRVEIAKHFDVTRQTIDYHLKAATNVVGVCPTCGETLKRALGRKGAP